MGFKITDSAEANKHTDYEWSIITEWNTKSKLDTNRDFNPKVPNLRPKSTTGCKTGSNSHDAAISAEFASYLQN